MDLCDGSCLHVPLIKWVDDRGWKSGYFNNTCVSSGNEHPHPNTTLTDSTATTTTTTTTRMVGLTTTLPKTGLSATTNPPQNTLLASARVTASIKLMTTRFPTSRFYLQTQAASVQATANLMTMRTPTALSHGGRPRLLCGAFSTEATKRFLTPSTSTRQLTTPLPLRLLCFGTGIHWL
jgi:hypothetical protein